MCMISVVTTYGKERLWPDPLAIQPWVYPHTVAPPFTSTNSFQLKPVPWSLPMPPGAGVPAPDHEKLLVDMKEYLELIEKARKLDVLLGQPDCPELDKEAWIAKLEERVRILEREKLEREEDAR